MIKTAKYYLGPGLIEISDAALAYGIIIRVAVEGTGFNLVQTTPDNRECLYTPSEGKLRFKEFLDDLTALGGVFVKYKI